MLNLQRVNTLLTRLGFNTDLGKAENGEPALTAKLATVRGDIFVFAMAGGARIAKPNGTAKYYYEVSDAKFAQYIRQILAANK